jgi:hypothetical protein
MKDFSFGRSRDVICEIEMNDFRFGRSRAILCGHEEPLEFVSAEIEDELREGVGLWAFVARVLVGLPARTTVFG